MKKNHYELISGVCNIWKSKLLKRMRIVAVLILFSITNTFALDSYAQSKRLSLNFKNETIVNILDEIEEQSEFYFMFDASRINVNQRKSVDFENQSIQIILDQLFENTGISYNINDRQVLLTSTEKLDIQQQTTVSGKVTDSSGQPLPGVTVIVKGTTNGTVTDFDGYYSLSILSENAILQFSFVGMKSKEIVVSGKSQINVVLEEESIGIEEVVAIGYGTVKRETATGSISTSKGEELERSPVTDLTNSLAGRISGVTTYATSGEPGRDESTIRIRGTNTLGDSSPLIVIDGIANREMGQIQASDIESMTVLKDASAAIYGAQAANGVILITTKRGSIGKPTITFTSNSGINTPTRIPDVLNSLEYATMLNEVDMYTGVDPRYSEEDIQLYSDGTDPWGHPNTDWYGTIFKDHSKQNSQNLSISGGSESMKYFLSLGHKFQDGYYVNSGTNYKQYNFRANIDGKVNDFIDIGFDVSGRQSNSNYGTVSTFQIFSMLQRGKPNMVAFWPSGEPGPDIEFGNNPAVTSTNEIGYNLTKDYVFESVLKADIRVPWIEGLKITGNASIDKSWVDNKIWEKPWYLYTWNGNQEHKVEKVKRGYDAPQLTMASTSGQKITWNVYATYEKSISDVHNFKVMVGTERQNFYSENFSAFRKNFISGAIEQLFAGAADQFMSNDGSASQSKRANVFSRINYDYKSKYLIEILGRYDGSYKFPKGKQFGFFPGVSLGWRVSEENFWNGLNNVVSNFKIRGSWGQTGNDKIAEYQYLSTYEFSGTTYDFNGEQNKILDEARIANPNVTWEVATQANIGFEAYVFDNLSIEFDYFNNTRKNILWRRNATVPGSSGLTLPPENIGKVANQGFEFVVGYRNNLGEFNYNINLNASYAKNKVVFWDEAPGRPVYQQSTGKPIPSNPSNEDNDLFYQAIGVFKDQADLNSYPHWAGAEPGDVIFEDVNNDGAIDGLDRVRNDKNNVPRFTGGLNLDLQYRQWSLNFLFQGTIGAVGYINGGDAGDFGNYYQIVYDNRWTPENRETNVGRAHNRNDLYWVSQRNTYWLRSTDYLRLKNLEIGYDLSPRIAQKAGIQSLRISLSGTNLITWDKFKLFDPEMANFGYPLSKVMNLGLTLTL